MRTPEVFHIWFPAYHPEFAKYSPGLILLIEMAQHCAAAGIERVDLGKGSQRYKKSFASAAIPLAEGVVTRQPLRRLLGGSWYRGRRWLRNSPLRPAVQAPKRMVRKLHYWKKSV